ncbi:MAG: hypothetical protein DI551_04770 [Micavibrio aeruginosavorus]|uniref:Uncharacterized protein n=1 Tax=Micavibrio aeruginosavorus TaxID=349221 RepID=A0A2W5N7B1_9BACT|nr:MAG: hypothetical protein DI551_04770 [Micavibrio aeruginosavorus]
MKRPVFFACLAVLYAGMAYAQPSPVAPRTAFFEALYDVPVMPGLEEVKDQAMLFDKPGGKIASVTAASKSIAAEDILGFYGETLPQLGWKKVGQNQYVRGQDRLVMDLVKKPPLTIVHFTLSPAS